MPRSIEQITALISEASKPNFRGELLARGLARNLIWSQGEMPEGAQQFSPLLTTDLLSYGLSLFSLGLELRTLDRVNPASLEAFARAGEAIESVVRDGDREFNERGFYTVLAAASYHLGHFSARAFSLFPSQVEALNLSPAEHTLTNLLRRDFGAIRHSLLALSVLGSFDQNLASELEAIRADHDVDHAVSLTLNAAYHQALAFFDYALDTGDTDAQAQCLKVLDEGVAAAQEMRSVPFWWIFTVTRHLVDDLWDQSFHVRLPHSPTDGPESQWRLLRRLFIAKLRRHPKAEIDLWPSQLLAAERAIDTTDDIVAALPTSAGKTRIAEICILRTLSFGMRVVFVTPLRALSAQTEKTLRHTFAPLGFTISSLYGSSGATGDDVDSLKNRDIVVSTPEKLDFALRNDPSLLDNVGLIVLDEAHTIGAGEREVRYEVLVQRLLKRDDALTRRIVCLSAILPQGDQLKDFVSWIRQDQSGGAVTLNWRPTRQRFGEIVWRTKDARLTFRIEGVEDDAPYVDPFLTSLPPKGKQTKSIPRDRRDLCILSAWRLVEEGQTVLMYCPERRSVIPTAKTVLDLVRRGYLNSLLKCEESELADAINIGREWLGENHPALQCLRIGVAVHHGQLPRPFLRAVEHLLKERLLPVTISSPTLAQGLNLSATTVLFTGLKRGRELISGEEFANVAGRAGRAFVDVEGQVICAAWEKMHLYQWDTILKASKERDLKSGLLQLIVDFCSQIALKKQLSYDEVLEYVTGNEHVWMPPKAPNLRTKEERKTQEDFEKKWRRDLACLDSAILSLIQHDIPTEELAEALDEALKSSLWERSLKRESEATNALSKALLDRRASSIWRNSTPTQRKGYFFAGIGFATGQLLDMHADRLNKLLEDADDAFADEDTSTALAAIISIAEIVFAIEPFNPDELPDDWKSILKAWVKGESLSDLAGDKGEEILEFIEGALVYRLVWAIESVRVRKNANEEDDDLEELENAGRSALAIETGTANYSSALLIQSGLASRIAAMKAVADCPTKFDDMRGLRAWLKSSCVAKHQENPVWPTEETAPLWRSFVQSLHVDKLARWHEQNWTAEVDWQISTKPPQGTPLRLVYDLASKHFKVYSLGLETLGFLPYEWTVEPAGIAFAKASTKANEIVIEYLGPNDLFVSEPAA